MPTERENRITLLVCRFCDREFEIDWSEYVSGNCVLNDRRGNRHLCCPSCRSEVQTCPRCNYLTDSFTEIGDDLMERWRRVYTDGRSLPDRLCSNCHEELFAECCVCDREVPRVVAYPFGCDSSSDRVCQDCRRDMCQCDNCGTYIDADETYEDGEYTYCERCNRDQRREGVILPYGSQPTHFPLGRGPIWYGLELEVEVKNDYDLYDKATEVQGRFPPEYSILTSDASVAHGFEIVTRPGDIASHRDAWSKFFNNRPNGLLARKARSSVGLHVHASRKPMTGLSIGKTIVFVNHPMNRKFMVALSGRDSCQYTKFIEKKINQIHRTDRYEAVNLQSDKTIEFRVFRATITPRTFWSRIEFCEALVEYCQPGNSSILGVQTPKQFINYVLSRKKRWPDLKGWVEQHGMQFAQ